MTGDLRVTLHGVAYRVPVRDWIEKRERVLQALRQQGVHVVCLCQNPPIPMHVRKTVYGLSLVTNPKRAKDHAQDCPRRHENWILYDRPYRMSGLHAEASKGSDGRLDANQRRGADSSPNALQSLLGPPNDEEQADNKRIQKGIRGVPTLDELNAEQRTAATHKDGPCLVVAAAGSGKTATLMARTRWLIEQGIEPRAILLCTFTKKATSEMRSRLQQELGQDAGRAVKVATLHSVAYSLVMPVLGEGWQVQADPAPLIEQALGQRHERYNPHGVGPILDAGRALQEIARYKADGLHPDRILGEGKESVRQVYAAYEAIKRHKRRADFEDLLDMAVQRFRTDASLAAKWRGRWQYIMVDEFQDTNTVQWQFLVELVKDHLNLLVVGDDYQSIYGFRGARPELMAQFSRTYPQARRIFLHTNYRSHEGIIDLSGRIIALNRGHQIEKIVRAHRPEPRSALAEVIGVKTDVDEAKFVADEIARLRRKSPDVPFGEYAVLYRTNTQSRIYEEALTDADLPYTIVGDQHFYETPMVQTLLRYLRTTQDTSDPDVWLPILNRPQRYIARATIEEFRGLGWSAVEADERGRTFTQTIRDLASREKPADALTWLVETQKGLVKLEDDEPLPWVESLIDAASRHETTAGFLAYVDRVIERSKEKKPDAVQLMTIHRSKGLEFHTVFVGGMVEDLLPHRKNVEEGGERAIREETRLVYVAMTRAKDNLFLLTAEQYGKRAMRPSRYIKVLAGGP
ncbi:MAG: ATP-dependent helicase [Bacilli bacterium]